MPLPDWFWESWDPAIRLFRAVIVFVCHAVAAAVAVGVMRFLELVLHALWPDLEPRQYHGTVVAGPVIWGGLPLDFVFQAIDLGLVLIVGGFGLYEAVQAYRRPI